MRYIIICTFLLLSCLLNAQISHNDYIDFITVKVFHDKDIKYIDIIKNELSEKIIELQFELMSFKDIPIQINIAPDRVTYDKWVNKNHIFNESIIGFADLTTNEIFIKNPTLLKHNGLIPLLLHEYIHIFINDHWEDVPLWFHEGMALYFSDKMSRVYSLQYLSKNAFHSEYLLLKYAYKYPDNKANLDSYYFQAGLIMRKTFEDKKHKLLNMMANANKFANFSECFRDSFLKSEELFLSDFGNEMDNFYKLNRYLGIMLLSWALFPIILIIAKIKQNSKNKELLSEWEMENIEEPFNLSEHIGGAKDKLENT